MASVDEAIQVADNYVTYLAFADTDEKLSKVVNLALPRLLALIEDAQLVADLGVRRKVMEALTHINGRIRSLTSIELPTFPLLLGFVRTLRSFGENASENATSIALNLYRMYTHMAFERLEEETLAEILPFLFRDLTKSSKLAQKEKLLLSLYSLKAVQKSANTSLPEQLLEREREREREREGESGEGEEEEEQADLSHALSYLEEKEDRRLVLELFRTIALTPSLSLSSAPPGVSPFLFSILRSYVTFSTAETPVRLAQTGNLSGQSGVSYTVAETHTQTLCEWKERVIEYMALDRVKALIPAPEQYLLLLSLSSSSTHTISDKAEKVLSKLGKYHEILHAEKWKEDSGEVDAFIVKEIVRMCLGREMTGPIHSTTHISFLKVLQKSLYVHSGEIVGEIAALFVKSLQAPFANPKLHEETLKTCIYFLRTAVTSLNISSKINTSSKIITPSAMQSSVQSPLEGEVSGWCNNSRVSAMLLKVFLGILGRTKDMDEAVKEAQDRSAQSLPTPSLSLSLSVSVSTTAHLHRQTLTHIRALIFTALSLLIQSSPDFYCSKVPLLQMYISGVEREREREIRESVLEGVRGIVGVYRGVQGAGRERIEELLQSTISNFLSLSTPEGERERERDVLLAGLRCSHEVFVYGHSPSRYWDCLCAGHERHEVRDEALRGLEPTATFYSGRDTTPPTFSAFISYLSTQNLLHDSVTPNPQVGRVLSGVNATAPLSERLTLGRAINIRSVVVLVEFVDELLIATEKEGLRREDLVAYESLLWKFLCFAMNDPVALNSKMPVRLLHSLPMVIIARIERFGANERLSTVKKYLLDEHNRNTLFLFSQSHSVSENIRILSSRLLGLLSLCTTSLSPVIERVISPSTAESETGERGLECVEASTANRYLLEYVETAISRISLSLSAVSSLSVPSSLHTGDLYTSTYILRTSLSPHLSLSLPLSRSLSLSLLTNALLPNLYAADEKRILHAMACLGILGAGFDWLRLIEDASGDESDKRDAANPEKDMSGDSTPAFPQKSVSEIQKRFKSLLNHSSKEVVLATLSCIGYMSLHSTTLIASPSSEIITSLYSLSQEKRFASDISTLWTLGWVFACVCGGHGEIYNPKKAQAFSELDEGFTDSLNPSQRAEWTLGILKSLTRDYIAHPQPQQRQFGTLVLTHLLENIARADDGESLSPGAFSTISQHLNDLQRALIVPLLYDRKEIVQETAGRGLSVLFGKYCIGEGSEARKEELMQLLSEALMSGTPNIQSKLDIQAREKSEDESLFPEGMELQVGTSQSLSTYKELHRFAVESAGASSSSELLYSLLGVARNEAEWGTRAGLAASILEWGKNSDSDRDTENLSSSELEVIYVSKVLGGRKRRRIVAEREREREKESSSTTTSLSLSPSLSLSLSSLIPRLVRYQYDPNIRIQSVMVKVLEDILGRERERERERGKGKGGERKALGPYMKDILKELTASLISPQWREREASALALSDYLSPSHWKDLSPCYRSLWDHCMRVMDDIKESCRDAAKLAWKSLCSVTLRLCNNSIVTDMENAEGTIERKPISYWVLSIAIPMVLKKGISNPSKEISTLSLQFLDRLIELSESHIKPFAAEIIASMLEALSSLEPSAFNYLQNRVSAYGEEREGDMEKARISLSSSTPSFSILTRLERYICDKEIFAEVCPKIISLIQEGLGFTTCVHSSRVITRVVMSAPVPVVKPHLKRLCRVLFSKAFAVKSEVLAHEYLQTLVHLLSLYKSTHKSLHTFLDSLLSSKIIASLESSDAAGNEGVERAAYCVQYFLKTVPQLLPRSGRHSYLIIALSFVMQFLDGDVAINKGKKEVVLDLKSTVSTIDIPISNSSHWRNIWKEISASDVVSVRAIIFSGWMGAVMAKMLESSQWSIRIAAAKSLRAINRLLGTDAVLLWMNTHPTLTVQQFPKGLPSGPSVDESGIIASNEKSTLQLFMGVCASRYFEGKVELLHALRDFALLSAIKADAEVGGNLGGAIIKRRCIYETLDSMGEILLAEGRKTQNDIRYATLALETTCIILNRLTTDAALDTIVDSLSLSKLFPRLTKALDSKLFDVIIPVLNDLQETAIGDTAEAGNNSADTVMEGTEESDRELLHGGERSAQGKFDVYLEGVCRVVEALCRVSSAEGRNVEIPFLPRLHSLLHSLSLSLSPYLSLPVSAIDTHYAVIAMYTAGVKMDWRDGDRSAFYTFFLNTLSPYIATRGCRDPRIITSYCEGVQHILESCNNLDAETKLLLHDCFQRALNSISDVSAETEIRRLLGKLQ